MRRLGVVVFLVLLVANGVGYFLWTRPASASRRGLTAHRNALEQTLADETEALSRWRRVSRLVEQAQTHGATLFSEGAQTRSLLRETFVEAEKGLGLEREAFVIRPDTKVAPGYRSVRIQLAVTGEFANLLRYLYRIRRVPASLACVELTLKPSAKMPGQVLLTGSWLAVWPEGSDG